MTVVDYETPLPELLESAYRGCEVVQSPHIRRSNDCTGGYRILGETMALGGSVPAGSWPACQRSAPGRALLLRTVWRIAGSAAISPVPQRPRGQPQPRRAIASTTSAN